MGNNREILSRVILIFLSLALVLLIAWTTGSFYYHFSGRRLVDLYSYFQLLATAYISFLACRRLEEETSLRWRQNPSARPFFISAVGFLFLGLDDVLSLHENMDKLIHHILNIKETPWTDHIDDFILLIYGIIAIFFIKDFIREFRKHPYMVGLIITGLGAFFIMFCLDFVSNNIPTFSYVAEKLFSVNMGDNAIGHMRDVFRMADESFELFGEACFLSAFVAAFTNIRTRQK